MILNLPCPHELMSEAPTITDAAAPATNDPEQVAAMAAALQAGINESAIIDAMRAKMAQGGLRPERGDFCIAPLAWKEHVKNPPAWLTFSAMVTDKPIFSPASHLQLAR